jgi:hypothetical protein
MSWPGHRARPGHSWAAGELLVSSRLVPTSRLDDFVLPEACLTRASPWLLATLPVAAHVQARN